MEIYSKHPKIFLNQIQEFHKSRTELMHIAAGLISSGLGLGSSHGQSPDVWKLLVRLLSRIWS